MAVDVSNDTRFMVVRPEEMVRLLTQLQRARTVIYMTWGEKQQALTTILEILKGPTLVIDRSQDETVNRALLAAERIVCKGQHEGVAFHFALTNLARARLRDEQVLSTPLPQWIYWRQQREFFRVSAPRHPPIALTVPATHCLAQPTRYPILDFSMGGLAFLSEGEAAIAEPGELLTGCQFELPGKGQIVADLMVHNIVPLAPRRQSAANPPPRPPEDINNAEPPVRKRRFRYGCAFTELALVDESALCVFLNERQRELAAMRT